MSWLKKFWIVFVSFLPFSAGAIAPAVLGGIAGIGAIAGFSIYRSAVPVNMADALSFFSTCWTCQMFADIMATMSSILPRIYNEIGKIIIPIAVSLTAVWFAWKLLYGFFNAKIDDPWTLSSAFGVQFMKTMLVVTLLAAPLPRIISNVAIEPIFHVGLAINRAVGDEEKYNQCIVSTAIADPVTIDRQSQSRGAFSASLRHNLACELAGLHQMTGLGMTVGWTMINMAFNEKYMHKILWDIPFFPNVPILILGLFVLAIYFCALLPIPLYFLEIFITLSMDLVMLPLMLLSWLFSGWKIFPNGGRTIKQMIDDVVAGALGLAMTGIFLAFSITFLNAMFGAWKGADILGDAIKKNDSTIFLDAIMMNNDSLITIILMGLFITMFVIMIPALSKSLFNVKISDDFYKTAKNNAQIMWNGAKKWYDKIKK